MDVRKRSIDTLLFIYLFAHCFIIRTVTYMYKQINIFDSFFVTRYVGIIIFYLIIRIIIQTLRGRTDSQGRGCDLMRGSVPRCIAYDRRERSADGAFFAADADVRETCASSRLSD